MTQQELEKLEAMIGDDIDDKAMELVKEMITPAEDNMRLKAAMEVIAPTRTALINAVEKALDTIVSEMMHFATEGFMVFYKEGFYNGIHFADSIFETVETGKGGEI